jgi:cytochrome c
LPEARQTGYLCRAGLFETGGASIFARSELHAMDSFEMNKVLGAVLGTCMALVALNIAAGAVFTPKKLAMPGYDIKVPEHAAPSTNAPPAQEEQPIGALLANADAMRGQEAATRSCGGCHTFDKGGAKKVGPNLYGVVGRQKASLGDFNYSAAMKGKGGNWSLDDLNHFLTNPRAMVPNTNMTFGGVSRNGERADIIAYLNSLADNPAPLPKAELAPTRFAAQ